LFKSTYRTGWLGMIFLLALNACAQQARLLGDPQEPYPPAAKPRVGDIVHLRTGRLVTLQEMTAAAGDSRVVYVAETHDNPASHALELEVLQALDRRYPGRVAVAMEMFTPSQQQVVDGWVSGEVDQKRFLRSWYEGWRMDIAYYEDILDYCRDHGIRILGINAERSLVQEVGEKDFADLPVDQHALLPKTIDMDDPYQQALTRAIYGGHAKGGMLAGFQRVQTLWDETMAENIFRFLDSPQGRDSRLLVLAGGNHIAYGFGIPRRVFRSLPVSYTLIGNEELEVSEAKKKEAFMDVTQPRFPMPPYDYLVYSRYEELDLTKEVKLGIAFEERAGTLVVSGIFADSSAAHAGVQIGDVLRKLDGADLSDSFDLIYWLKEKKAGDSGTLLVEREGKEIELKVLYQSAPPAQEPPPGLRSE